MSEKDEVQEEVKTMVEKHPAAVVLGSLGGKKRAANMSPEERAVAAKKAAEERWRREKQSR